MDADGNQTEELQRQSSGSDDSDMEENSETSEQESSQELTQNPSIYLEEIKMLRGKVFFDCEKREQTLLVRNEKFLQKEQVKFVAFKEKKSKQALIAVARMEMKKVARIFHEMRNQFVKSSENCKKLKDTDEIMLKKNYIEFFRAENARRKDALDKRAEQIIIHEYKPEFAKLEYIKNSASIISSEINGKMGKFQIIGQECDRKMRIISDPEIFKIQEISTKINVDQDLIEENDAEIEAFQERFENLENDSKAKKGLLEKFQQQLEMTEREFNEDLTIVDDLKASEVSEEEDDDQENIDSANSDFAKKEEDLAEIEKINIEIDQKHEDSIKRIQDANENLAKLGEKEEKSLEADQEKINQMKQKIREKEEEAEKRDDLLDQIKAEKKVLSQKKIKFKRDEVKQAVKARSQKRLQRKRKFLENQPTDDTLRSLISLENELDSIFKFPKLVPSHKKFKQNLAK
ncbi:hypothetical protein DMENIID0001_167430 [Sergentomyia squamirostris]